MRATLICACCGKIIFAWLPIDCALVIITDGVHKASTFLGSVCGYRSEWNADTSPKFWTMNVIKIIKYYKWTETCFTYLIEILRISKEHIAKKRKKLITTMILKDINLIDIIRYNALSLKKSTCVKIICQPCERIKNSLFFYEFEKQRVNK